MGFGIQVTLHGQTMVRIEMNHATGILEKVKTEDSRDASYCSSGILLYSNWNGI